MSQFKKIGGKYGMHSGSAKYQNLEVESRMYIQGNMYPAGMIQGKIWYVDRGQNTAGDGTSWDQAFKTITAAVAAAGDNDAIFIAGGANTDCNYAEAATVTITQDNLKIFGPNVSHGFRTVNVRDTTAANDIFTIKAHGVEICGLSFYSTTNDKSAIAIGVDADATSYHGIYIHDCFFYATSGEYGVMTFTAPDAPDLRIENCKFQNFQTAAIKLHATRGEVRNCDIQVPDAKAGIAFTDRGPLEVIEGNNIVGSAGTSGGITISGNNDGNFVITHNTIVNCGTSMTQDVGDANIASTNYVYNNGTGVTVVDPNSG